MADYDPNLLSSIPQEVTTAARLLTRYFAERNIRKWRLDGCASRDENAYTAGVVAGMEEAAKIARAAFAEKMNVGPMWIYHRNVERDILAALPNAEVRAAERNFG